MAEGRPAGGAELLEVVLATGGALAATAVLLILGIRHRAGRTDLLRRIAGKASRLSGLPPWAALPVELASLSLLVALFGMYWDISLHIDDGRDAGPLANPAHYFILAGLFGIFAAGFLAVVLPDGRPSRSAVRLAPGWYAPVGGVVLLACSSFALMGFPLDDFWHRLFGQDVTLWGPTHLMLIGGAGLSLLGHAILLVEGGRARAPQLPRVAGVAGRFLHRTRYAAVLGGLLIGLSTFQAEFDFGVPQFQLLFQPVLIALAAGVALVAARIYAGPGGALAAAAYFVAIRGIVSLLVGPVLGETTPHLPLYVGSALLIELAALRVAPGRTYRFGAVAGLLVGTLGTAAEWGWSQVWMPIAWPSALLGEAAVAAPLAGLAGGLMGAFLGTALVAPRHAARAAPAAPGAPRAAVPALAPAVAGLALAAALIGYGLDTRTPEGTRVAVTLAEERPAPERAVSVTARVDPPDAAGDARWLNATAWQGGALVVDRLERIGPATYRTTQPIPVHGDWKSLLRLHTKGRVAGVPIYLPDDPAIPAEGVPAPARFTRDVVADMEILQRERKDDVPAALPPVAHAVVLAIALALIGLLGWALRRLALSSTTKAPPVPAGPSRVRGEGVGATAA